MCRYHHELYHAGELNPADMRLLGNFTNVQVDNKRSEETKLEEKPSERPEEAEHTRRGSRNPLKQVRSPK